MRATSLDGSHPNGKEVANKFQTILQKQQDKCDALNSAMFKLQKFQKKIQDQVQILQQATKSVEPDVKKIKLLEKVLQYMDILKDALETRYVHFIGSTLEYFCLLCCQSNPPD